MQTYDSYAHTHADNRICFNREHTITNPGDFGPIDAFYSDQTLIWLVACGKPGVHAVIDSVRKRGIMETACGYNYWNDSTVSFSGLQSNITCEDCIDTLS